MRRELPVRAVADAVVGDFKSVLTYHPQVAVDDFVSLTMPVRVQSYVWDDQLPPVLQMNLPEGYLLQVLQEQFGPHIGASPIALLSVIGRNMVGRLQVAAPGESKSDLWQYIEFAKRFKIEEVWPAELLAKAPKLKGKTMFDALFANGVVNKFKASEIQPGFGRTGKLV